MTEDIPLGIDSEEFDRMDGEPDIELLKPGLPPLLEFRKKTPVLRRIFGVHKNAVEFVAVFNTALMPKTLAR